MSLIEMIRKNKVVALIVCLFSPSIVLANISDHKSSLYDCKHLAAFVGDVMQYRQKFGDEGKADLSKEVEETENVDEEKLAFWKDVLEQAYSLPAQDTMAGQHAVVVDFSQFYYSLCRIAHYKNGGKYNEKFNLRPNLLGSD